MTWFCSDRTRCGGGGGGGGGSRPSSRSRGNGSSGIPVKTAANHQHKSGAKQDGAERATPRKLFQATNIRRCPAAPAPAPLVEDEEDGNGSDGSDLMRECLEKGAQITKVRQRRVPPLQTNLIVATTC